MALFSASCRSAQAPPQVVLQELQRNVPIYFLEFDDQAKLTSHGELERLRRDVDEPLTIVVERSGSRIEHRQRVDHLVVVSLGWSWEDVDAPDEYLALLARYLERHQPSDDPLGPRTAVVCVVWPASARAFSRACNDVLPFHALGDVLGLVPDALCFPFTFWSKAALADAIGGGHLHAALRRVLADGAAKGLAVERVTLIGHSFGARIVAALARELARPISNVGRDSRRSTNHAPRYPPDCVLLVQPAISLDQLSNSAQRLDNSGPIAPIDFPIWVTQTAHDHANGAMFPLGNAIFNTHGTDAVLRLARSNYANNYAEVWGGGTDAAQLLGEALWHDALEPLTLLLANLPTSVAGAAAFSGLNAFYELREAPGFVVPNTLANLPLTDALMDGASAVLPDDWQPRGGFGRRSKGLLGLGWRYESAGTPFGNVMAREAADAPMDDPATPGPASRGRGQIQLPVALYEIDARGDVVAIDPDESGTPPPDAAADDALRRSGLHLIDVSTVMHHGSFLGARYDQNSWMGRYIAGWLDPTGAHSDYREAGILDLMHRALTVPHLPPRGTQVAPEVTSPQD